MNTMESMINERIRLGEAYIRGMLCEERNDIDRNTLERYVNAFSSFERWLISPTNRKVNEMIELVRKKPVTNVEKVYTGNTPDKLKYIFAYRYERKDAHSKANSVYTMAVMENVDGFRNPRLIYGIHAHCLDTRCHGDSFVVIEPHALDRYAERYLKLGTDHVMTDKEISDMLFMCMNGSSYEDMDKTLNLYMENGIFLGGLYKVKDCPLVNLKTFIANHNMFQNQSLRKRKNTDDRKNFFDSLSEPSEPIKTPGEIKGWMRNL